MSERDQIAEARKRVTADTAKHTMKVKVDQGVYRHLVFTQPEHRWLYWFEIVTWPGSLSFRGDVGTFTFARTTDMFEFFRRDGDNARGINPRYWGEKHKSVNDGREPLKVFSEAAYLAQVREWRDQVAEGIDDKAERAKFVLSVRDELLDLTRYAWRGGLPQSFGQAYEKLSEFDWKGHSPRDYDLGEWSLSEWDWSYLWACTAIVDAIGVYDAAQRSTWPTAPLEAA